MEQLHLLQQLLLQICCPQQWGQGAHSPHESQKQLGYKCSKLKTQSLRKSPGQDENEVTHSRMR